MTGQTASPAPIRTSDTTPDVAANLATVKAAIASAAHAAGRDPGAVTLVAVSKTMPPAVIRPALEAGHRVFGENKVQEGRDKWPDLRAAFPGVELHLIGPLQSNKARDAVALFDVIQTVDRPKIATALAAEMERQGRRPRLLIQVNTGEEPQKAGLIPADVPSFLRWCTDECGLAIDGLMAIPPVDDEPAMHFALLDKMAADLGLAVRSMGMSGDFETAVRLGATHVRVGSSIFGARKP